MSVTVMVPAMGLKTRHREEEEYVENGMGVGLGVGAAAAAIPAGIAGVFAGKTAFIILVAVSGITLASGGSLLPFLVANLLVAGLAGVAVTGVGTMAGAGVGAGVGGLCGCAASKVKDCCIPCVQTEDEAEVESPRSRGVPTPESHRSIGVPTPAASLPSAQKTTQFAPTYISYIAQPQTQGRTVYQARTIGQPPQKTSPVHTSYIRASHAVPLRRTSVPVLNPVLPTASPRQMPSYTKSVYSVVRPTSPRVSPQVSPHSSPPSTPRATRVYIPQEIPSPSSLPKKFYSSQATPSTSSFTTPVGSQRSF